MSHVERFGAVVLLFVLFMISEGPYTAYAQAAGNGNGAEGGEGAATRKSQGVTDTEALPPRAELLEELRSIYEIESESERIRAYDQFAASLFGPVQRGTESAEGAENDADPGEWITSVETDPISDESVFFTALEAQSGRNEFGEAPVLAVRRTGERDEVYVIWSDYFSEDSAVVTHRIDDNNVDTRSWPVSTTNEATFYPGDATQLLKDLVQAEQLAVRAQPYDASPITAVFELQGLRAIVEDHRELVGHWLAE
jgi:hypothetical protein